MKRIQHKRVLLSIGEQFNDYPPIKSFIPDVEPNWMRVLISKNQKIVHNIFQIVIKSFLTALNLFSYLLN